jgi:hypothetical protein
MNIIAMLLPALCPVFPVPPVPMLDEELGEIPAPCMLERQTNEHERLPPALRNRWWEARSVEDRARIMFEYYATVGRYASAEMWGHFVDFVEP